MSTITTTAATTKTSTTTKTTTTTTKQQQQQQQQSSSASVSFVMQMRALPSLPLSVSYHTGYPNKTGRKLGGSANHSTSRPVNNPTPSFAPLPTPWAI
ncbi:hypothetical protein ElyMa_004131500 [Elysia marginata]|uniref:Uncharacterized protein n=1 Tax=Elysia marginata TaxID=1093978 RepID=A0AAV4GFA3_9GAST|nr:hypothetical protein ElyMa_004131500 [Elysia marginata]